MDVDQFAAIMFDEGVVRMRMNPAKHDKFGLKAIDNLAAPYR